MRSITKTILLAYVTVMFGISAKISFLSEENSHPDEKYHLLSAQYYLENSLPPRFDNPDIINTYSKEGYSRLNDLDGTYWFSGKLASAFRHIGIESAYWNYRLFNLFLLVFIVIRFVRLVYYEDQRYYAYLLFLAIPQVWYIFSYANDDALPLFLSLLLAELTIQETYPIKNIVLSGLLFGLLFLSKSNYFIFILFAGTTLMYRFWKDKELKLALIPGIALVIIGLRYLLDAFINGWAKGEYITQMVQRTALPQYKDPAMYVETFMMKSQGVSIKSMVFKYQWFQNSLKSFYAVFGKMDRFLPDFIYHGVGVLIFILAAYGSYRLLTSQNHYGKWIWILAFLCTILMFYFSFDNSWTFDFQPQGRYLFPLVATIGIVGSQTNRGVTRSESFLFILLGMLAVGCYWYLSQVSGS